MGFFSELFNIFLGSLTQKCDEFAANSYTEYMEAASPTDEQRDAYERSVAYLNRRESVSLYQSQRALELQLKQYEEALAQAEQIGDKDLILKYEYKLSCIDEELLKIEDAINQLSD